MKILHFFKTYYPDSFGGVEQVIYHLAEGGAKYNLKSEVLYLSRRGSARNESYANHVTHRSNLDFYFASTGFSISAFRDFRDIASAADVVHYHFPWPFMDLVHFCCRLNKPTVVTYHSDIVKQKWLLRLYAPLMHTFLSSVDRIVATSPNYNSTSKVLQRFQNKVSIIPIGLDASEYGRVSEDKRKEWANKLGGRFFLFIGALRYYKGLHVLLEALVSLDYPVAIVGAGPLEDNLKLLSAKLSLKNVHFLGALPDEDKNALLELSFCVVFPSHLRAEAFGISLLEGALYKKPLISCEIGSGTTYVNIDELTGLVVPPDNPLELRKAMRRLWNNPELAESFGMQAEARYKSYFTADLMVDKYRQLYESLLT
jgi:rhamnosyl/mannosyltransferase